MGPINHRFDVTLGPSLIVHDPASNDCAAVHSRCPSQSARDEGGCVCRVKKAAPGSAVFETVSDVEFTGRVTERAGGKVYLTLSDIFGASFMRDGRPLLQLLQEKRTFVYANKFDPFDHVYSCCILQGVTATSGIVAYLDAEGLPGALTFGVRDLKVQALISICYVLLLSAAPTCSPAKSFESHGRRCRGRYAGFGRHTSCMTTQ